MSILRKKSTSSVHSTETTHTFKYVGKAPARPDGTLEFRVKQVGFQVTFQRDDPFSIVDDGTPQAQFVLKCLRGAMEYDWGTGGQIKQYEEITDTSSPTESSPRIKNIAREKR